MLNKKYKCPVCLEECITLRDRFRLDSETLNSNISDYKNYITCRSCNAKLNYKKTFDIKSIIIWILYLSLLPLWFISEYLFVIGDIFAIHLLHLYETLFGELEEYQPSKIKIILNKFLDNLKTPKYDLNKFLDNLKNSNCEK